MLVKCAAFTMLAFLPLSTLAQASAGFEIEDFSKHIALTDPQISPDEQKIAYVRSSANETLNYEYEIVLVDVASRETRALTNPNQFAHSPL